MAQSHSIHSIIDRLRKLLFWKPTVDESSVPEVLNRLADLEHANNWCALPGLLPALVSDHEQIRVRACGVAESLLRRVPQHALTRLDLDIRDAVLQAYQWNRKDIGWVRSREWPTAVWALFSMHPNGFIREAAVEALAKTPSAWTLPFLLLRMNDWVEQVRASAEREVRNFLTIDHLELWLPAMGMLESLGARSRHDHSALLAKLKTLLLSPEGHQTLWQATQLADRSAARWAFRAARDLPEDTRATAIERGLSASDPVVRLRCGQFLLEWKDCPGRAGLIAAMWVDSFMPVRRLALYAALEEQEPQRRLRLEHALLDRHASMRHAACFYLGSDRELCRSLYARALTTHPTAAALLGLGEVGQPSDVAILLPFIASCKPSLAASAVRAIVSLDRDARLHWLAGLVDDPRPAVVKAAVRGLGKCGDEQVIATLRRMGQSAGPSYSREAATKFLLKRPKADAIPDALRAVASGVPALHALGIGYLHNCYPLSGGSYPPSARQLTDAVEALTACESDLDPQVVKRLREWIAMGT